MCCLDGEKVIGSRDVLSLQLIAANRKDTTKLLSQHFRCTVFGYLSEGETDSLLYFCSFS